MPRSIVLLAAAALIVAAWFGIWSSIVSGDVARVKASIDYHYQRIKAANPHVTFKAETVESSGFPFRFRVRIVRPTLTQIDGTESYAISFSQMELQETDAGEGRYRVIAPAEFDAMYAQAGKAPEKYRITMNDVPAILLRAQGDSGECPAIPGLANCAPAAKDAPLISFAAQLPKRLILDASLNGKSETIGFTFTPLNLPIFMTIPADPSRALQLFVGMLREALVFRGS